MRPKFCGILLKSSKVKVFHIFFCLINMVDLAECTKISFVVHFLTSWAFFNQVEDTKMVANIKLGVESAHCATTSLPPIKVLMTLSWSQYYKTFFCLKFTDFRNTLVCLSLASLYSLI